MTGETFDQVHYSEQNVANINIPSDALTFLYGLVRAAQIVLKLQPTIYSNDNAPSSVNEMSQSFCSCFL